MEENNQTIIEGYSKVEVERNSKGVNITIKANGRDYQNLENIKNEAVRIFKDAEKDLGISQ